jgi:hypothetical protein
MLGKDIHKFVRTFVVYSMRTDINGCRLVGIAWKVHSSQESLCWGHCCRVADVVNKQVKPFVGACCIQAWIPCTTEGFIFMRANKARVLQFVSLRVVAQLLVPAQCLLRPTRRLAAAAAFSCEWLHCCVYICHSSKLNPFLSQMTWVFWSWKLGNIIWMGSLHHRFSCVLCWEYV